MYNLIYFMSRTLHFMGSETKRSETYSNIKYWYKEWGTNHLLDLCGASQNVCNHSDYLAKNSRLKNPNIGLFTDGTSFSSHVSPSSRPLGYHPVMLCYERI